MRVRDLDFDFADALSDAAVNAASDWDVRFIEGLTAKHEAWGAEMFITPAQLDQLNRINGE